MYIQKQEDIYSEEKLQSLLSYVGKKGWKYIGYDEVKGAWIFHSLSEIDRKPLTRCIRVEDFHIAVIILDYYPGYGQDVEEVDEEDCVDCEEDQGDGGYEMPCSDRDFYGDL